MQPRDLRRFEAALFKEYASNNKSFESCLLSQGAPSGMHLQSKKDMNQIRRVQICSEAITEKSANGNLTVMTPLSCIL